MWRSEMPSFLMPDSANRERADSPSSLTPESYGSFGDRGDDISSPGSDLSIDSFTPRKPSIGRDISARGSKKKKRKAKAKKVRFSRTRRPRRSKRQSRRIRRRKPTPYRSTSRNRKSKNSASSITFSPTDVPTY